MKVEKIPDETINDLSVNDTNVSISYLKCYQGLIKVKNEIGEGAFNHNRYILCDVSDKYGLGKGIDDKEALKRLGLENEVNDNDLARKINEIDFSYSHADRIYFFDSKQVIPYDDERYFLLITICLNNFSDLYSIKGFLEHQYLIYPYKKEFLDDLKFMLLDNNNKIIPPHKVAEAVKWIEGKRNELKETGVKGTEFTGSDENKRLSHPAIALMHVYLKIAGQSIVINGKACNEINESNHNEIAEHYGWKNKSSGRNIFMEYKYFQSENERIQPNSIEDPNTIQYKNSRRALIKSLKGAMRELQKYPQALAIAEGDLRKVE